MPDAADEPPAELGTETGLPTQVSDDPDVVDAEVGELVGMLPPEGRKILRRVIAETRSHQGPLPTPEMLREYEEVLPGLAERIVRLPEKEQEHRHDFSDIWLRREARLRDRGQIFGMIALVIILAFCAYLAWIGEPKMGAGVAIALVAAVVGIFVTGKVIDSKTNGGDVSP